MSKFRNAFGARRVSGGDLDKRTSAIGVHKSLFSYLQQIGYEGSPAATSAWALVKAVRPVMKDHRDALVSIGELPRDRLQELRDCAVRTSESAKTKESPARGELIGDIIAMLDGLLSRIASPLVSGAAPAAPDAADEPSLDLCRRRDARALELLRSGVPADVAGAQAVVEIRS